MRTKVLGISRGCRWLTVADLNALNVLSPRRMLVTKAALDAIRERAAKAKAAKSSASVAATEEV